MKLIKKKDILSGRQFTVNNNILFHHAISKISAASKMVEADWGPSRQEKHLRQYFGQYLNKKSSK